MPIDVTSFCLHNVIDTCAVWNLLSSEILYAAAVSEKCHFCMTRFVRYECLSKPRSKEDASQRQLKAMLQEKVARGDFLVHSISLEHLLEDEVLSNRQNLGKGELTTIAFAKLTRQAVMTDDKRARKLSTELVGAAMTQTTCHLFGWLFYIGKFMDHEKQEVMEQHSRLGGKLRPHLEAAYLLGMHGKLYAK